MKVVLIGDSAVGKTSIVNAITNTNSIDPTPTINFAKSDVNIKIENGEEVTLCLWDTAGQETYQALAPIHARESKAQILVFDVNDNRSFLNLPIWYEILEESSSLNCIFVVGNKIDKPEQERKVSFDDGMNYATKINATYVEVSAKTRSGINELFEQVATQIVDTNDEIHSVEEREAVQVHEDEKKEKQKSCC